MRHLVTIDVDGRPASFATAHETAWKEAVSSTIAREVSKPWTHERFSVRLRFRTVAPTRAGEEWDLDNLIKPTLDAMSDVLGERQWRGVSQPADDRVDHLEAWKSTVRDGEKPGATIEVWAMADEPATPSFSRADLESRGFVGFEPFLELDATHVPKEAGVYAVLRERDDRPTFLEQSRGGHFKGKDPTVGVATLAGLWTDGAHCIYIGKASKTGTTDLRRRLTAYRDYGRGRPVGHQGGRYIWQLGDAEEFRVCWKTLGDGEDPATVESALIAEFRAHYGRRPIGNLKD